MANNPTTEPKHPSNMTPAELEVVANADRSMLPDPHNHFIASAIPSELHTPALAEEAKRQENWHKRYFDRKEREESIDSRRKAAVQISEDILLSDSDLKDQLDESRESRENAQLLGQKAVDISKLVNESPRDSNESARLLTEGMSDQYVTVKPGVNEGSTASTIGEYNTDGEKVTTKRKVYRGIVQVDRVDKETGETVYSKIVPDPTLATKVNTKIAREVSDAARQDIAEAIEPLIGGPGEIQKPD